MPLNYRSYRRKPRVVEVAMRYDGGRDAVCDYSAFDSFEADDWRREKSVEGGRDKKKCKVEQKKNNRNVSNGKSNKQNGE